MFFYRYNVVESHINCYAWKLFRWMKEGRSEKVKRISPTIVVHKLFDPNAREWVYFAFDESIASEYGVPKRPRSTPHPAVAGLCTLNKMPRWVGLETTMLYVSPAFRGKGIATKIYDAIMADGKIVISGYSHNQKSRRLWMTMVQSGKYTMWAHDIIDLSRFADLEVQDGKFVCSLKLYEDIKKLRRQRKQDVRIIAFNPKYVT